MLIIYDIFIGIETGRQDIFTKQAFYQSYIRACRIILQTFQLAQESDQTILE